MKTVKITKGDYRQAEQLILADPRCDDAVKLAVRRGTDPDIDRMIAYTFENETWYDTIICKKAAWVDKPRRYKK